MKYLTTRQYIAGATAIICGTFLLWLVTLVGGCDWGDQTIEEWNAHGQRVYRRRTSIGSFLKESLIENGSMISEPNYFEITVEHAELNTSDIKAVTPYGTLEIE